MSWLVITDLDGTLLDDDYPYESAAQALDTLTLEFEDLRLALASSKTLAEMERLAKQSRSHMTLIFENGAGIAESSAAWTGTNDLNLTLLGTPYAEICGVLHELRHDDPGFAFRGFHEMSRHEVSELTGLDPDAAGLARNRLASEPLLWLGTTVALERFREALAERNLKLEKGGRFHLVTGPGGKRAALDRLLERLARADGDCPRIIACGDAPNDLELIDIADRALVFPQRNGSYLRGENDRVAHAAGPGPAEWLEGVRRILRTAPGAN